jgi:hypothetical protein
LSARHRTEKLTNLWSVSRLYWKTRNNVNFLLARYLLLTVNWFTVGKDAQMAGFVESTVKDIDSRISELRAELAKLEAARSALLGGGGGGARATARRATASVRGTRTRATRTRAPRAGARRGPGRPRGRRGGNTRANQALELVAGQPGITIPEIATKMGIEPNYLYRVMPKLVTEGRVRRDGQGWHPAS